jgi:hypothetical protein
LAQLGAKLAVYGKEGFMRFCLIVAAAVAAVSIVAPAQAAGCNLGALKAWMPFKGRAYRTEAYSNGTSCAATVATIVVRGPDGKVFWTDAHDASFLMTFAHVKTPRQMQAALADWLTQQHPFKSTGDLPEWKRGAEAPTPLGEFPFYQEEGMDQVTYAKIRAERQALFCYVQGMESLACIAIDKAGVATKVGVQSFPG